MKPRLYRSGYHWICELARDDKEFGIIYRSADMNDAYDGLRDRAWREYGIHLTGRILKPGEKGWGIQQLY